MGLFRRCGVLALRAATCWGIVRVRLLARRAGGCVRGSAGAGLRRVLGGCAVVTVLALVVVATEAVAQTDPVTVSFGSSMYSVSEGASVAVTVELSGPRNSDATVQITAAGSASVLDYSLSDTSVMFAADETSKTVTVTALEDRLDDDSESVTLTLEPPSGLSTGTHGSTTAAIVDGDQAALVVEPADVSVRGVGLTWTGLMRRMCRCAGTVVGLTWTGLMRRMCRCAGTVVGLTWTGLMRRMCRCAGTVVGLTWTGLMRRMCRCAGTVVGLTWTGLMRRMCRCAGTVVGLTWTGLGCVGARGQWWG